MLESVSSGATKRRRSCRRLAGVLLLVPLVGVVACGGGSGSPAATSEPSLAPVARLDSTAQVSLPLDAFAPTPEQMLTLQRAQDILTRDCMRRFGLDFATYQRGLATVDPLRSRRFAYLDLATAQQMGFHPPVDQGNVQRRGQAQQLNATRTPTELAVLGGTNVPRGVTKLTSYHGQRVPPEGCAGEARAKLAGNAPKVDDSLVFQLTAQAGQRSEADSRTRAAARTWSACMKKSGYSYSTPVDANNDRKWHTPAPTEPEINAATADAHCLRDVNWLGLEAALNTAYQKVAMEPHAEALSQINKAHEAQLRNAAAAVRGG
jgi:hypothetical protein